MGSHWKLGVSGSSGQREFGVKLCHQAGAQGVHLRASGAAVQQVEQPVAQRPPGAGAFGKEMVERGFGRCRQGLCTQAVEHTGRLCCSQVDDLVANGHTAAKRRVAAGAPEHRQRQVLDGEVGAGGLGGSHPAGGLRVVGGIQCGHDCS